MTEATAIALDFYETGMDEPIGGVVVSTQGLAVGPPTTRSYALEPATRDAQVCRGSILFSVYFSYGRSQHMPQIYKHVWYI